MGDENLDKDLVVDDDEGSEGIVTEPEYSELEVKAMDMGWKPQSDFGDENDKDFLSAKEFVGRKEIYDEIHSLKRALKNQKKSFNTLTDHHNKVKETERQKAIDELKSEKALALKEEEYERVVEIDEELAEKRSETSTTEDSAEQINEDFNEWVTDNSWYQDDDDLRSEADELGEIYWRRNPEKSRKEVYGYVSEKIKKMNSDKFENENRGKSNPVEGKRPSGKSRSKSKYSSKDLTSEQKSIMNNFVRQGVMTEEQYINELVSIGEVG